MPPRDKRKASYNSDNFGKYLLLQLLSLPTIFVPTAGLFILINYKVSLPFVTWLDASGRFSFLLLVLISGPLSLFAFMLLRLLVSSAFYKLGFFSNKK